MGSIISVVAVLEIHILSAAGCHETSTSQRGLPLRGPAPRGQTLRVPIVQRERDQNAHEQEDIMRARSGRLSDGGDAHDRE